MKRIYSLILITSLLLGVTTIAVASAPASRDDLASGRSLFPPDVLGAANTLASAPPYARYVRITDESESVRLEVPVEWNDIETGHWMVDGQRVGIFVAASASLYDFYATRAESGVFVGVSQALVSTYNEAAMRAREQRGFARACQFKGRFDFRNPFYLGHYDQYLPCAQSNRQLFITTLMPQHRAYLALIRITLANQSDLEAAARVLRTFQVLGNPEVDEHHH